MGSFHESFLAAHILCVDVARLKDRLQLWSEPLATAAVLSTLPESQHAASMAKLSFRGFC